MRDKTSSSNLGSVVSVRVSVAVGKESSLCNSEA
jgi:hypothetical protein